MDLLPGSGRDEIRFGLGSFFRDDGWDEKDDDDDDDDVSSSDFACVCIKEVAIGVLYALWFCMKGKHII